MRSPPHCPRPRAFEAEQVRRHRQRMGVYASNAVHTHLGQLHTQLPKGTEHQPRRGRATAILVAPAISAAIKAGWGTHEAGAVALLTMLIARGFLPGLVRAPSKLTAGSAMALLARFSPLIEQVSHGRYRIHACRPDCLPPAILESLLRGQQDDAPSADPDAETLADGQQIDSPPQDETSIEPADSADPLSVLIGRNRERARGDLQEDPSSASDGEQLWLEPDYPGAAAGSIFDPAEEAPASPTTPPARPKIKPLVPWTRSGWVQAVPPGRHVQRAAVLALEHLVGDGRRGTAATLAAGLAGYEERTSARHRAALARALETLRRRGLLVVTGDCWRVPEFALHPALELFDVLDVGDDRPVSPGLADYLRRSGIDPEGLGHDEALAVSGRLYTRRSKAATAREEALADLPPDLRKGRRLDLAQRRVDLRRAMEAARWAVDPWTARDHGGRHG